MTLQERIKIKELIAKLRSQNAIFQQATDFEILEALLQCAITKSE